MSGFEYRVVPAPARGIKAKGVKTPEDRFAHVLEDLMNRMGAEGWEYQRAETLPSTERAGLTGTTTQWRHVLIFRRAVRAVARQPEAVADRPAPVREPAAPAPIVAPEPAAPPADGERPSRPTLVATRNDPADSGV